MRMEFSKNEMIEMAIQIERRGLSFYKSIEKSSKKENIKSLFKFLVDEEKKHIETFEGLRDSEGRMEIQGPYDWEEVGLYFKGLVDNKIFPDIETGGDLMKEMQSEASVIVMAISIEKDNILFFHEMNNFIAKEDSQIVNDLIDEEKGHVKKLLELKKELGVSS